MPSRVIQRTRTKRRTTMPTITPKVTTSISSILTPLFIKTFYYFLLIYHFLKNIPIEEKKKVGDREENNKAHRLLRGILVLVVRVRGEYPSMAEEDYSGHRLTGESGDTIIGEDGAGSDPR